MKDFILLTAVCLLVVFGVGWFLLPGSAAEIFRSHVSVQPQAIDPPESPEPAKKPASDKKQPIIRETALYREPESVRIASVIPTAEVKPAAVAAPAATPYLLPQPWNVLPGEQASELVDTYGTPSLSTSTQDEGHVFETYVYRNSGTQSIVHLEDGRVSSVLLKGSPSLARP